MQMRGFPDCCGAFIFHDFPGHFSTEPFKVDPAVLASTIDYMKHNISVNRRCAFFFALLNPYQKENFDKPLKDLGFRMEAKAIGLHGRPIYNYIRRRK